MATPWTERVTIRVSEDLLEKVDECVDHGDYHTRSQAVRTAIRQWVDTQHPTQEANR